MAIAAAARSDTVGRVMSHLEVVFLHFFGSKMYLCLSIFYFWLIITHACYVFLVKYLTFNCSASFNQLQKSVEEERYGDAALIRDRAGAGLVS